LVAHACKFIYFFAAYLSATQGDAAYATNLIGAVGPEPRSGNYPVLSKLLAIAQAEVARVSGKPDDSIKMLEPLLDGSELSQTHLALLDAYASAGNKAAALQQSAMDCCASRSSLRGARA